MATKESKAKITIDASGAQKGAQDAKRAYETVSEAAKKAGETIAQANVRMGQAQEQAQRQQKKATQEQVKQEQQAADAAKQRAETDARFDHERRVQWDQEYARIQQEIDAVDELKNRWQEYREAGGKMKLPVSGAQEKAFEADYKRIMEATKQQKDLLTRFMDEMTKIGVLRGGVEWRFARALGAGAIVPLAAVMIVEQIVKRIRKAVDDTVQAIADLSKGAAAMAAFQAMGGAIGSSWSQMTQAVREATGYAMTGYEITIAQNRLLLGSFDDLLVAMPELAAVAKALGDAMGVDAGKQLDALMQAIEKGDTQTLEATWGFRGVSAALQETADRYHTTTGSLDRFTRSSVILNQILPQTKQKMAELAAAGATTGDAMKAWWEDVDSVWKALRARLGLAAARVFGIGGAPTEMEQRATAAQLRTATQLAIADYDEAVKRGEVQADMIELINNEYERTITLQQWGLKRWRDYTEEIEWSTDAILTLTLAREGLTREEAEAAKAAERRSAEEIARAEALLAIHEAVTQRVRAWALEFAEVPGISFDEALASAEAFGQDLEPLLVAAYDAVGQLGTLKADYYLQETEGLVSESLDRMKVKAILTGQEIVNQLFGYTQAVADIGMGVIPLALELTAGMSEAEALAEFNKLYGRAYKMEQQWAGKETPQEQFIRQRREQAYQALLRQDKQLADDLKKQRDDWLLDLVEAGMPFEEAAAEADRWAMILQRALGPPYSETLGGPLTAAAQAAEMAVKRAFGEMLADVQARSPQAFRELGEDLEDQAQKLALRLSPYMGLDEVLAFEKAYLEALLAWRAEWFGREETTEALDALSDIERAAEAVVEAMEDANKVTKATAKSLKDAADNALLGSKALGKWAEAFAAEHGGAGPMETYKKHAQPLVAAMIDKLWAEDFARQMGRPPSEEEWRAHWYEQWAPLELYPGGPIAAATGPMAERAKEALKLAGIEEDLGDVYNDEYLKRLGLVESMSAEQTQLEKLAEAMGNYAAYINSLIPPSGEEDGDEDGEEDGGESSKGVVIIDLNKGKVQNLPMYGVPEFQRGGVMPYPGLAYLHAGEAVLPPGQIQHMVTMRMAGVGAASVNIGSMSIPVTINGGGNLRPAEVQAAVISGIRLRGGAEILRAARRLGV